MKSRYVLFIFIFVMSSLYASAIRTTRELISRNAELETRKMMRSARLITLKTATPQSVSFFSPLTRESKPPS